MEPYQIFPRRIISHSEAQDRLMQVALNPDQIQSRADEILARKGTFFGHRVAYIHIPFCEKLCKFCTFFRVPKDEQKVAPFMDALMESIRRFGEAPYVRSVPFEAVYFGGGTPTTISPDQIRLLAHTIRESLPLAEDVEFTSESTFANITDEMLEALREGGVNRMSLGVQTFSPKLRNLIGRECHPDDVIEKIEKVRRVMPVVNLDLIYNFPTQTLKEWKEDLKIAGQTGVNGISVHPLIPVDDSPLSQMIQRGELEPMGEAKEQYTFYSLAQEMLPEYGYNQISFCHFATGPHERIAYLRLRVQEGDCFAFGAGAVGNLGSFVFFNFPVLDAYMEMVKEGEFPAMVAGDFTPHFQFLWELTGQIQHMRVEKEYFKKRYGMNLDETYGEILRRLQEDGLIENTKETFTVTPLGRFWVYNICTLFQ